MSYVCKETSDLILVTVNATTAINNSHNFQNFFG